MTRNNSCQHVVDVGDKSFERISLKGEETAYLRFYGFVNGTQGANKVNGMRFIAYGPEAELIFAHIKCGSRVFVISHVQVRRDKKENIFTEFVIEEIQYIRNVNWEEGTKKRKELIDSGQLRPSLVENPETGDFVESHRNEQE